jgi:AcrR family transcriptional regulator
MMEMATTRPARLPAPERREQILDVTKAIVGEAGFHGVSIDRVAREAGITRPVVYTHFQDLSGLLHALVDREGVRALAQLGAVVPKALDAGDPVSALVAALRGYLEAVRAEPVTWRLVLMPPEGAPEILRERIAQGRAAIVAQLAELVAGAFAPVGGQNSPDPELTAHSMSALADAWARLMLTDPEHFDPDRLVAHAQWFAERFAPGEPVERARR